MPNGCRATNGRSKTGASLTGCGMDTNKKSNPLIGGVRDRSRRSTNLPGPYVDPALPGRGAGGPAARKPWGRAARGGAAALPQSKGFDI